MGLFSFFTKEKKERVGVERSEKRKTERERDRLDETKWEEKVRERNNKRDRDGEKAK